VSGKELQAKKSIRNAGVVGLFLVSVLLLTLGFYRNQTNNEWIQAHLEIGFYQLFILFAFFSLLFLLISFWRRNADLYPKTLALLYTTWFSILPPLSWLIIFKAHAYIHGQLDYIIWQMPFVLFGFALCGMTIRYIFSRSRPNNANLLSKDKESRTIYGR
jgi:hypothetical protein